MFQKKMILSLLLTMILSIALAACSVPLTGLTLLPQVQSNDTGKNTVVSHLGIGILKMEGTSQAVTSAQASTLLPLWKAVYKMGNDKTASKAEVSALYDQIHETLTADQVSAISQATWTQQELNDLMQKYGSSSTTSSSSSSSSSKSQQSAGGPPDMGGMPGGPGGDITSVGAVGGTGSSSNSSAKISQASSSSSTDLNPKFASAIITVLQKRITAE
jgi:hypothetical protein